MKKDHETDGHIVRSGTRIRESVRCLPKGHFQQIRHMFDKQSSTTMSDRPSKSHHLSSRVLRKLPVTDDEKLQHTIAMDDVIVEDDQSLEEHGLTHYDAFRNQLMKTSNREQQLPKSPLSSWKTDTRSYTTKSSPSQLLSSTVREKSDQRRQLAMAAAVNYADSYESSPATNHLNRIGSTRQYVSSLQRASAVNAKPVLVKTTCNMPEDQSLATDQTNDRFFQTSRRLHSSTSLSSTGYDSNSSPSMISKRNSLVTNHSNDFSTSSDERLRLKPWTLQESGIGTPMTIPTSCSSDDVFDSTSLISRSQVKLIQSPTSSLERHPVSVVRHATIRNSSVLDSPSVSSTSSAKYIVQTTSFPNRIPSTDCIKTSSLKRKHPLGSTAFSIQQHSSAHRPVVVQKQANNREESPLPPVENPLFQQSPPRKPPRTFQHENRYNHVSTPVDQKLPSSSSSTNDSPTYDLGSRSISCMDLTVGVSHALLSSGLLPLDKEPAHVPRKSSTLIDKTKQLLLNENIYEELRTPLSTMPKDGLPPFTFNPKKTQTMKTISHDRTPPVKVKSVMKKGISEPNLAKTKSMSTFFSPRGLLDRFKRILPLSLSKQSLNDNHHIDSDDSASSSSENNDDLRTHRLDHVSRVKNVYDTLGSGNHISSLFTEPNHLTIARELPTLYDYVVHLISEEEFGYFSNGTGCLSSSNLNLNPPIPTSTSVRFKYPLDATDEPTLKYFCFPDQHDTNNNYDFQFDPPSKKAKPQYFRFTLTDMRGTRLHGYCSRFIHKGILNALCIMSPCDTIELYEKILSTATELFISYKDEDARKFLIEIYPHRLPTRGDTIHIHTETVGLYTLKCDHDRRKQLIDSTTLLSLSTDTIIKIFSSILYEQKIIFIANELGPLTRVINTFICLLYPFSWPHTYVPILPALMLDVIQAPTPYIIGILRSCEVYLAGNTDFLSQDNSDVLIVDIDHDRIRFINDYIPLDSSRSSLDNLLNHPLSHFQILPKIFKIELKQEISFLRKNNIHLSLDECQQRLCQLFMSIFVQSCYNYKEYLEQTFDTEHFIQSKHQTIELFLEWFTRTQIFQLFIRQKLDSTLKNRFALTFDVACEKYRRTLTKQTSQRMTVKSVKRKAASRASKQDQRL